MLANKTSSPAVAKRPRDAPCLSVVSFNSTIRAMERDLLVLVTSASDLPLHTNKFCSVLFYSAYSLMRGVLCAANRRAP